MSYTVPLAGFFQPLASWLHLGGALVAVFAASHLRNTGATPATRAALAVFAGSAIFALSMSGVYHALTPTGAARGVMQRLDHAAIWILIGGTFTPVHAIMFSGVRRWGMLAFIWACAITGVVLKTVFFASVPPALGLWLYLALGWVGAVSATMLAAACGRRAVGPLLIGGVLYSVGAAASILEAPTLIPGYLGPHEIFHLAVLAALLTHWRFIASLHGLAARASAPAALLHAPVPTAP
jgi:channel protein (hemolysin III family)